MTSYQSSPNDQDLVDTIDATEKLQAMAKQDALSKLKNEREKATFSMMMKMNPEALTNIRKEFFARRDSVTLDEFIYIIQKHLVNRKGDDSFTMETPEQREFGTNMYELFKDIDVNGDGQLEWQEFTSFTVEKANLLNKRAKLTSIAHYHDSSSTLDASARYRHRHDISRMVKIPNLGQFAVVEDHKNSIFVFNSRQGKQVATIPTEAAPIAIENIPEKDRDLLVTAGADMTLSTFTLDDPNPKKKYKAQSTWATPGVQMALAYAQESKLLYSGATNGNIYSWNVRERALVTTLPGHSDIVMSLMILKKLNNIASASLDKTVCVWDSHTNEQILSLHGHRKGVFDLTYNPDYRLIFSCGFEHDACVWSPFVNSLVYRLKGHHASLVGCQSVENSPELITADTSGVFKLWDVRNFQCVQTFSANLSGNETKDSSKLTCFFHSRLPSRNAMQKEDDSRIYAASKMMFSFDQARVVHEATTDYYNVNWIAFNNERSVIFTASDHNVIVWDALIGSKTFTHTNICGDEISACCLDDRRRKIIIGDTKGRLGVYNCSNGACMKHVHEVQDAAVVALRYHDDGKRFIAAYANGHVCVYDENVLEECHLIRQFDCYATPHAVLERELNKEKYESEQAKLPKELLTLEFDPIRKSIATAGGTDGIVRLWDFESTKCLFEITVCDVKQSQIVSMIMLLPYPIVATADSSGNIVLWGSIGIKWQGWRLSGFLNMTPGSASFEPVALHVNDEETSPRRALPPQQAIIETNNLFASLDRTEAANNDSLSIISKGIANGIKPEAGGGGEDADDFSIDEEQQAENAAVRAASSEQAKVHFAESESKWGRISAAQTMSWHAESFSLYSGDDLGTLRAYGLRDFFEDMQSQQLAQAMHHTAADADAVEEHLPLGLCQRMERSACSALAPIDHDITSCLIARAHDSNCYLGARFNWMLYAHHDRIIFSTCTPQGLLTAAADRLVKMWSHDGILIGTLKQSVPVGTRSRTWDLVLDVASIVQKETEELDEIIEEVSQLAAKPGKPDIASMDFTGMQLGAESANFSRSVLRQRIELTANILGLDFPTTASGSATAGATVVTIAAAAGGASGAGSINKPEDITGILGPLNSTTSDGASITSSSGGGKSLVEALKEIKSTESGVDYEMKTKQMSYIQQRRKANKLDTISKAYEERSGVKVHVPNTKVDLTALIEDKAEEVDGAKADNIEKLLVANETPMKSEEESVHDDFYSVHSMHAANARAMKLQSPKRSNLDSSIQQAKDRGARTISMLKSCKKYAAYSALDAAIEGTVVPALTEDDKARIRHTRDRKSTQLMRTRFTQRDSSDLSAGMEKLRRVNSYSRSWASVEGGSSFGSDGPMLLQRYDSMASIDSMEQQQAAAAIAAGVATTAAAVRSPRSPAVRAAALAVLASPEVSLSNAAAVATADYEPATAAAAAVAAAAESAAGVSHGSLLSSGDDEFVRVTDVND